MRVYIWVCGRFGWCAGFKLETLPNMRATDLLALVSGLALHGNVIQVRTVWADGTVQHTGTWFYRFEDRKLHIITASERDQLGLTPSINLLR